MKPFSSYLICLILGILSFFPGQAQVFDNCAAADAGAALTLSGGNYLNQNFDVPAANTLSGLADPACIGAATSQKDNWVSFVASQTGTINIEYTPTSGQDALLAVYSACGAAQILRCSNDQGANGTETLSFGTISGNKYFIRVINLSDLALMQGQLSLYTGSKQLGDLCQEATEVSIGTCDFNFDLYASFLNLEGLADPGPDAVLQDGWLRFEATAGQRIQIDLQTAGAETSSKNLGVAAYEGTCGNLTLLNYANNDPGGGKEIIEFDVLSTGSHYLRIMNLEDSDGVIVNTCITELYGRNLCGDLPSAPTLLAGQCNVPVNVFDNADYTATASSGNAFGTKDIWLQYSHSDPSVTEIQLDYFADEASSRPLIVIYDASGINCANTSTNIITAVFAGGQNASSISFPVAVGSTYYIQVADQNPGVDLVGKLCLYDESKKAEDNFFGARDFAIDNSDCGLQFNVSRLFNGNGGLPDAGATVVCTNKTSQLDAWAKFSTAGTLSSGEIIVEYDNDNQDPSDANDVALTVYEVPNITESVATTEVSSNCADARPAVNEDITLTGITVLTSDPLDAAPSIETSCAGAYGGESPEGDQWITYTATVNTPITIYFEGDDVTQDNLALAVYDNTCSSILECTDTNNAENIATLSFTPTLGLTYHIRIVNLTRFGGFTSSDLNGVFGIYNGISQFLEVGCVNAVEEGTESISISGAALKVNTTYLVRVSNINEDLDNPSVTPTTTTGSLCIRDGEVNDDDICSTARELVVGDCNIQFNLTEANLPVDQPGAGTVYPASGCLGGKTIQTEAWASFSATASVTTIEYAKLNELGKDAAIAIYRGSCGALIPVGPCGEYFVDDQGTTAGIESISINTIIGVNYYVQVMNLGTAGLMEGKLCIFNTTERDVCDDDDLVNLIPDACNVRFNVPATFSNTGIDYQGNTPDPSGDPANWNRNTCGAGDIDYSVAYPFARDSWVRIIGNGDLMTVQYQNDNSVDSSDPMMILYTAILGPGPVDCGVGINGAGNPGNQFTCANEFGEGQQTETMTFQSEAGRLYILRLLDLTNGEMQGSLCLFSGGEAPELCADAPEIDITTDIGDPVDIGACNVQFNVLSNNACSTTPVQCNGSGGTSDININVGGPAFTSAGGVSWESDLSYVSGGNTYTNNGCTMAFTGPGTPDPNNAQMYRSERYGNDLTYNIPVSSGENYDINLHFAEVFHTNDGRRVLQADIEGVNVLSGHDIHAVTGGRCVAEQMTYNVTENGDGFIRIRIRRDGGTDNNAKLSGITVSPTSTPPTVCEGEAWARFTTNSTFLPLPNNNITVQYDNTNNSSINSTDVSLEIYREVGTFDCNNPATYQFVGCSDKIVGSGPNAEGIEEVNFSVDEVNGNETYYIRVINKDATFSAFGQLCIFYGQTIARPNCAETLDYGDINGVWQNFKVLNDWNDTRPQGTIDDPPCVVPGGSNPVAPNPPVVSNAWTRFTVPINPTDQVDAVTVQYDNAEFSDTNENSENAAMAIYVGPDPSSPLFEYDPSNPAEDNCTLANLTLVDCVNSVWRGTESVTIGVVPGATYYVRVMNVKNAGKDMPGRLRVFEFVSCELGDELVVDGTFEGWGGMDDSANPAVSAPDDGSGNWTNYMNPWIANNNPNIQNYQQDEFSADLTRHIDSYSRFATDYGYLVDRQSGSGANNSFQRIRNRRGEFNPEGRYAVSQQAFTRKGGGFSGWDFYGYGNGYTGYGGHNYNNYCAVGSENENGEPCDGFGVMQSNRPALVPHTADANFMAVNGWWKRDGTTDPGKVWCQTIDIDALQDGSNAGYYVFTAWFQNLIKSGTNLDVPQLRITICDMENPDVPNDIGDANVVVSGATGNTQNFDSVLPGVTFTPSTGNPNNLTYHFPEPPENGDIRRASPMGFTFGAAEPCNLPTEDKNARLKLLGSDFLLPESPDQWQVVRCIYRAPVDVREFNLCIENLSLTKNGNDFAIDDISLRKCNTTNTDALDALLQGDACELADEPTALGIPLAVRMLDFSGKLLGNQVALSWITILERNTSHFEVQRSINGSEFTAIGEVDARGESQELASYSFIDSQLPEGQDFLYYRLRIIDGQGKSRLSSLVRVRIAELNGLNLKLYPNPVNSGEEVNLSFRAEAGSVGIKVSDLMGTIMRQSNIKTQEGINQVSLNTQNLSPGIYIIKVQQGAKRASTKLVISN